MSKDKFFKKMKKKPEQQSVIDNLADYTESDIEQLTGTHFPAWVKEELLKLKKRNGSTADDEAERIAEIMIKASQNH